MFWGLLWALCSFPLFFLSFHFFDQGAWYNSLFLAAVKIWCLYTGPHFSSSCPSDLFLTFFAQMAWSKKAQFSYNFLQKPYAPLLVPPSCFLPTGVEISTHPSNNSNNYNNHNHYNYTNSNTYNNYNSSLTSIAQRAVKHTFQKLL